MAKTLTLTLGGQERKLLFGTGGFLFHLREVTNQDPFEWLRKFDEEAKILVEGKEMKMVLLEDFKSMVYAGLNTYLDTQDQDNIPFQKVQKWCNGMTIQDNTDVFLTALLAFKTGEAEAPLNGAKVELRAE